MKHFFKGTVVVVGVMIVMMIINIIINMICNKNGIEFDSNEHDINIYRGTVWNADL